MYKGPTTSQQWIFTNQLLDHRDVLAHKTRWLQGRVFAQVPDRSYMFSNNFSQQRVRRNRAGLSPISSDSPVRNISETQPIIGMKDPTAIEPITQREQPLQVPSSLAQRVANTSPPVQCSLKNTSISVITTPRKSSRTVRLPERFNDFEMLFQTFSLTYMYETDIRYGHLDR